MKTTEELLQQATNALEAMAAEFRALDLPYGSKAYAQATDLLNQLRSRQASVVHGAKTVDQLYEELRAAIDDGNESMTHEDALAHAAQLQAMDETRAVVGYALYDIEHGGSRKLIWADQYTPEGDPTKTLVVPLVAQT